MLFTKSLKGRYNFKYILKRCKYVSCNNITIYCLKNKENLQENFLGICVSKKHGNSVIRNKIKRWVREAYKEIEPMLYKGYKIIVLYKKNIDINNINFHVVKDEIEYGLKKSGIYIDEEIN